MAKYHRIVFRLRPLIGVIISAAFLAYIIVQSVQASEPESTEVTINSSPEVIAEDFLRVAAVPPGWFYLLYNWVGTYNIDPNNITDRDLEKYVTDEDKREKIKKAIEIIKQFDTYPGKYRIVKWENMPIDISLTYEQEMDEAIRQTTALIENNTKIKFNVHKERISENGINIQTFGLKKEHTDFCVHDYSCTDLVIHGSTTYYKGDGAIQPPEKVKLNYFLHTLNVNQKRFDKIFYFTPNTRFTSRFHHDYHVNGALVINENYSEKYSACEIFNDHKNEEISKSLASECVLRTLGLTQFTADQESLLSERPIQIDKIQWKTIPDKYDMLLLNILYNEKLKSGMSKQELVPIIIQIINDFRNKDMED